MSSVSVICISSDAEVGAIVMLYERLLRDNLSVGMTDEARGVQRGVYNGINRWRGKVNRWDGNIAEVVDE